GSRNEGSLALAYFTLMKGQLAGLGTESDKIRVSYTQEESLAGVDTTRGEVSLTQLYELANRFSVASRFKEAIECYGIIAQLFPDKAEFDYKLARCHFMLNQFDKAITYLDNCIQKKQNTVNAKYLRAFIHERRGEKKEALVLLNEILTEDPQHLQAGNLRHYLLTGEIRKEARTPRAAGNTLSR
ncbi:MAG: CDC27 family protein, partial [Planctomycetes bacterium]|nr:CDC27 family protein [Planctomycetota bacterium]